MPRKASDVTVYDQFCGFGGSSIGAKSVDGVRIRMAHNHDRLSVDVHNENFPEADHECSDISAMDPRRFPSTTFMCSSPECTNHGPANGRKKRHDQRDLFIERKVDPSEERSRATMMDVPRFAEFHDYEYVIVENVVEASRWAGWDGWLLYMRNLGYEHRVVSANSMFFWPCPQSRDRIYVVFWKKGNHAPDLDYMPLAPCPRCERDVRALQSWKVNRKTGRAHWVGKYRQQYVYTCPACRTTVEPYYFCALNALDLSIPGVRIGDREKEGLPPLKPRTLGRIDFGLRKYGRQWLVVRTNMTSGVECRVRSATGAPLDTQPGSNITALVSPAFIETAFSADGATRASGGMDALRTQTGRQTLGVASPVPIIMEADNGHGTSSRARLATDPLRTQTTAESTDLVLPPIPFVTSVNDFDDRSFPSTHPAGTQTTQTKFAVTIPPSLVVAAGSLDTAPRPATSSMPTLTGSDRFGHLTSPAFVSSQRNGNRPAGLDEPLNAFCAASDHHALVIHGSALLTMRDSRGVGYLLRELTDPMGTQVATCVQDGVISKGRFVASYYGTLNTSGAGDPVPTFTGLDRHSFAEAGEDLDVNDCYFRMFQPHEVKDGMAFPAWFRDRGTKRQRVKGFGNAVTPPVMEWLIGQCRAALDYTRSPRRRAA